MPVAFAVTLFSSAALLFLVQPLVGRLLLPLLGGSPAVWNTSLVFFQGALLLGYAYADGLGRLRPRLALPLHAGVLLAALAALPFAVDPEAARSLLERAGPVGGLVALLVGMVALPFAALSATAPLLQKWLARTDHPSAADPYYLSVASNAGSLLGLIAYPLVFEPRLTLAEQGEGWRVGFAAVALAIAGCGAMAWRRESPAGATLVLTAEPVTWGRRLRWLALAAIPSSLLCGVSAFLSTDVAAGSVLWVGPLGLYLVTFMIAFSTRLRPPAGPLGRVAVVLALTSGLALMLKAGEPIAVVAGIHLAAFFALALLCHAQLTADRPGPARLTEFYFLMSLGGVLGGLFNVFAAPRLFASMGMLEYPLAIVLATLARPAKSDAVAGVRPGDILWPLAVASLAALAWRLADARPEVAGWLASLESSTGVPAENVRGGLIYGLPALACFVLGDRRGRFALALGGLLLLANLDTGPAGRTLEVSRGDLGVLRVTVSRDGTLTQLLHGTTVHGSQRRAAEPGTGPGQREEPLAYYHPKGPAGRVFERLSRPEGARVGVVGLGAGALASYARPGEAWDFYELDPGVERLARDERYFTYLSACRASRLDVRIGDARLHLATAPDGHYRILVLDAFSSDAIPLHLLTAEALERYRRKLAPDGLLLMHLSNRHLDLPPVVGRLAESATPPWHGLHGNDRSVGAEERAAGRFPSEWVLLANRPENLDPWRKGILWSPLVAGGESLRWTDDHASLWSALRRSEE